MEFTNEEKEFLLKSRLTTFRIYHTRTLAVVISLIKKKKIDDALEYLHTEISNIVSINDKEFGKLLDAFTLNLKLKDKNEKDTNSSP
jgi:hypothetical protein